MPDRQEKTDPEATPEIEIYSVSQEKDGTLKISRREFLAMALTVSSALLVAGCQTSRAVLQGQTLTPGVLQSQTPTPPADLPQINLYVYPEASSKIVEILHANDIVILFPYQPNFDTGWVQVTAHSGKIGWVSRGFVDFTRAFTRSTQEVGSNSTATVEIGTPMPGVVYVVLTMAGAPTPSLPITCPQYWADGPTTTPTPIPMNFPTPIPIPRLHPILQCGCVGYTCPCLSHFTCPCVSFSSCTCLSHFSCGCVSNFPCACLSHFSCGCVSYFPCSMT